MKIGLRWVTIAAFFAWAGASWAGTISGNVADYNAAQVTLASGALVVPANTATYTATSTLAIGSSFTVTLPSGFTFGTTPSLTGSGASTFALSGGGVGAQFATFTIGISNVTTAQTISLASFTIDGATALETVTPVARALPLTMQAIGTDATPLSFPAFASDVGATAAEVDAIVFIDVKPPSNGTEFLGTPDSLTSVLAAIAIGPETTDAATGTVSILSPNGKANSLSPADTAAVTVFGNFAGIGSVFISSTGDCLSPTNSGSVSFGSVFFSNVVVGPEVFLCETGSGGIIPSNPTGFTIAVGPGSSTDFLSPNINYINVLGPVGPCYDSGTPGGIGVFGRCTVWPTPTPAPALSDWAMIGLAGMMLAFGVWKLSARRAS